MSLANRLAGNFKAELVARVAYILSNGLIVLLLSRYLLTPDEYGLLFLALSVFAVTRLISQLGWAKSVARYVAEYQEDDPTQIRYIVRTGVKYTIGTTAIVVVVFALFPEQLAVLLNEPRLAPFLLVGSIYIVFRTFGVYSSRVLQGFNKIRWSATIRIVDSVGRAAFVVILTALGFGALGALWGYTLGYALSTVLGAVVLYRTCYRPFSEATEVADGLKTRIRNYSIPLTATYAANVLDNKVDTILVGFFMSSGAVAMYVLASQIVQFLQAPAQSLGYSISPTYGEQKASNEMETASRLYQATLRHTLLLYVPAAAGIVIIADPMVRLVFGTEYLGTIPVLQILSGYIVIQAINFITTDALDFLGRARMRAVGKGVSSIANFFLNILLIPTFGIVGAAGATVFTHSIYVSLNLWVIHSEFSLDLRRLAETVALTLAITGAMALAVYLFMPYVTGIVTLAVAVLIGVVVWVVLAVLSGLLDIRQIASLLA